MTPLHGIACFCDIGFGARAVSRKTPIFFILFDTHDMIIADFCFSRILQVQTLCVCVCQPKNCRKILEFWLIVNLETKKVPLLALGLSRRPGSASQLRLAPPKRLTMEEEEEKDSDEAGAMFLSTV